MICEEENRRSEGCGWFMVALAWAFQCVCALLCGVRGLLLCFVNNN